MTRGLLGAAGLLMAGYGGWLLLSRQDPDRVVEVGVWLGAGVLAHDLLVAVVALAGAALVARLPGRSRAPAVVALVVVGALTLTAVPVLAGFGAVPGNPTHLDRPYAAAWLGVVVVAALAVTVAGVVRSRGRPREED